MSPEVFEYEAALRCAVEQIAASRPALQVERVGFVDYLSTKVTQARAFDVEWTELHLADLYLAYGCLVRDAAALSELYRTSRDPVRRALARFRQSQDLGDDLWHDLFARLVFPDERERVRLASYAGRGPLLGWVTISAARLFSSVLERRNKESSLSEGEAPDPEAPRCDDAQMLKERYRERVQAALYAAIGELPPRDRQLLKLQLEGLSFHDIGQLHGVDKSTVFHWFRRIRENLRGRIKARFAPNVRDSELASILRLVRSQLDIASSGLDDAR